jgi:N-methylhydantoinase B/oxoprolinase/acetone carboxylase alpha subunit
MKKMNYEAPKAEMIEMHMPVVLYASTGTGSTGQGGTGGGNGPSNPFS